LAAEKSFLQLIVYLMNNISAVPGLENVIENLLRGILNGIGGQNIILYYRVGDEILYADVCGVKKAVAAIDDPLVAKAMETGAPLEIEDDFADTRMLTREFSKAHTWIYPLLVGSETIGVLRMESLHVAMRGMEQPLATFFAYVALVLKNEIAGQSRLQKICDDLSVANRQLIQEAAKCRSAQEALRKSHDELEDRVRERTAELENANWVLEAEIVERLQAQKTLQWELSVTDAVARLYKVLASPESTIKDIADHILTETRQLTGSPHGFVSEVDPVTGGNVGHTLTGMLEICRMPAAPRRFVFPRNADGTYNGLWGHALNTRQPFYTNEPWLHAAATGCPEGHVPIRCFLAVPVMLGESLAGMVALANKESGYTDTDLAAVQRIAGYYALAIQRMRAEGTIRHLASFPQLSPVLTAEFSRQGELVFRNPAMESAMKRWNIADAARFIPADWLEKLTSPDAIEPGVDVREIELEGRFLEERIVYTPEFESLRVYVTDVTERKQAEAGQAKLHEQLRHSQKMEAIGRLAGGVAHDFNNLLTVINGYSEMAIQRLPQGDPLKDDLREVRNAGERAASLTQQLLAFSRHQAVQPRVLDLNAAVREAEKMLRRVIGEDIELTCVLGPAPSTVKADLGQIHQVLMNLVVNARDAMPSGGRLVIETGNTELDRRYAADHWTVDPGSYVMLSVSDTGTGMGQDVLSHLFEPFFTTKPQGKGTGLGLATVFGIVKQAGGQVSVYSERGRGTTFRIYWPRVEATVSEAAAKAPVDTRGQETVLVVEDQPEVRGLTCAVLRNCGYHVLEAGNGEEALQVCRSHRGPIGLVVTDVVMPRIGGPELAECLKALRPEIEVLYVSGYLENIAFGKSVGEASANYLQKPFTAEGLARKAREILDRARARGRTSDRPGRG
jgi:signal transduction histidine kinase/ActR/RegA family two-component response regulator